MGSILRWPTDPNEGLRGTDLDGCGDFGANRSRDGREYAHKGEDFAIAPGGNLVAFCSGTLFDPNYAYADRRGDLRSYHILGRDEWQGYRFTILYGRLLPGITGFTKVDAGQLIATAEDVAGYYNGKAGKILMRNHVHIEARRYNPETKLVELVDPRPLFGIAV